MITETILLVFMSLVSMLGATSMLIDKDSD